MIACTITVGGPSGITYAGLFASTCKVVVDAMLRYPAARSISVKVLP